MHSISYSVSARQNKAGDTRSELQSEVAAFRGVSSISRISRRPCTRLLRLINYTADRSAGCMFHSAFNGHCSGATSVAVPGALAWKAQRAVARISRRR